jgi:uncharacterized protein (DUF1786 family)
VSRASLGTRRKSRCSINLNPAASISDVTSASSERCRVWTTLDHHQDRQSPYQFGRFVEKFEGGRICPMGVLQDHKHRSLSGDQFGIEPIGAKKGHTYAVFGQGVCSDFLMISRSNSANTPSI